MEEERKFIHSAHERMHGVLAKAIEDLEGTYSKEDFDEAKFALSWYDRILVRFCDGRTWVVDSLELRGEIEALKKQVEALKMTVKSHQSEQLAQKAEDVFDSLDKMRDEVAKMNNLFGRASRMRYD